MSAKPETQWEREELISSMKTLAKTHMALSTGSDLEERTADALRKAAAMLAADGKAGGEVALGILHRGEGGEFRVGANMDALMAIYAQPPGEHLLYTRPQQAAQVAQNNASTGRVSEFEGQMRIRWLKSLVEKQQDTNRYNNGYVEHDTGAWVGPEWVDTVHEALDDLVASAEASKGYRFSWTRCSACGKEFGPGDCGYSHCSDHEVAAAQVAQPLTDEQRIRSMKQEAENGLVIGDEIGMRDALESILREADEHLGIEKDKAP